MSDCSRDPKSVEKLPASGSSVGSTDATSVGSSESLDVLQEKIREISERSVISHLCWNLGCCAKSRPAKSGSADVSRRCRGSRPGRD